MDFTGCQHNTFVYLHVEEALCKSLKRYEEFSMRIHHFLSRWCFVISFFALEGQVQCGSFEYMMALVLVSIAELNIYK